jgi:GSH-dependent disulfide-bond oxidoreductase
MTMIALYAMGSPNVAKIYLALEEMELPYKVIPLDALGGAQFDPAFVRLNPNAKVPVIVDDDGPDGRPYTVFESGAILLYLADKTGRFLAREAVARYDAIQWMMVQMSGVGPMFGQYVHFFRFAPSENDYALTRYRTQVRRVLDVLEGRLAETEWLDGRGYTIADMASFPWARLTGRLLGAAAEGDYPKLMEWVARIEARPAARRALAAVEEIRSRTTQPDKAVPEVLDRVFGRGAYARA